MSRAFVKDDDDVPEHPLARPESRRPNLVTAAGLARLRERLAQAESSGDARSAEQLRRRIESAIVVEQAKQPRDAVAFGATVTIEEPGGVCHDFTIVGEDLADPLHGTISWISPLAEALLGARVGDQVVWRRPAGDLPVKVIAIAYR